MKLEPLALILAGIVLVLSTRSFEYLIMGGGMSRGLGSAFAVFAFVAALDAMETRSWRSRIACGFLVAGAVLSHLEWGISAGLGVSLLFLLRCERKMEALAAVSVVGAISLTLIAPWLWWVATAFGMDPFLAASQTTHRSPVVQLFYLVSLDFIPWYLVAFVVVGAVGHIRARKGFWLLFLLISYFLTPRHHPTLSVIAGSVLAADGILLLAALVPYWRRFIGHEADGAGPAHALTLPGPSHGRAMLLMLMTALWMVGVGITETRILREMRSLDAVSPDEARLLEWIGREIPPGETFVVVTEDLWSVAELGEWLPAVTPHRSLATAQGLEWIDGTRFWQVLYGHRKIRALAERAPASLPLYLARNYPPCAYVIAQEAGEYFFNQDGFTLIGRFGDTWLYRMTGTQAGPCLPGPPPGSM